MSAGLDPQGKFIGLAQLYISEKRNLRRAMRLLWLHRLTVSFTVMVAAIALALPLLFTTLARNMQYLAGDWRGDLQVQMYLRPGALQQRLVIQKLQVHHLVESWQVIDAAEGLAEFPPAAGFDDLVQIIGYNPLPDVVLVTPASRDTAALQTLIADLSAIPGVDSVQLDQKWAQTLTSLFTLVNLIAALVIQLLLIGVFMLIAGNVHALVARSANEIRIVKLIGATDAFVSRPYVYFGGLVGILSGLLAAILVTGIISEIRATVEQLISAYNIAYRLQTPRLDEWFFSLVGPVFLGMCAAIVSCRSAIQKALPDFTRQ